MNSPVFNWVVALKPEARPIIDDLEMKQRPALSKGGFVVFENPDQTHRLIISGIGKTNSAAAVSWLAQWSEKWHVWINFGIAGHRDAEIGTVLRAARITDSATGKSWYPTAVWPKKRDKFAITEVLTIDKPSGDYPETGETIEMEAAGFIQTALRFGSSELIQVVKVISDNQSTSLSDLNPKLVTKLVSKTIPEIITWNECLKPISESEMARLAEPEGWREITEAFHFTETERHILKRQIKRALALGKFESAKEWLQQTSASNGKQVIKALEDLLIQEI